MVVKIRKSLTLETQPPGVVSCLELLVVIAPSLSTAGTEGGGENRR